MDKSKYTLIGMLAGIILLSAMLGAIWLAPPSPSPIFEEEETDMVQYEQFSAVSGTNDDLEDLVDFHNLAEHNGNYYYAILDGDNFKIKLRIFYESKKYRSMAEKEEKEKAKNKL